MTISAGGPWAWSDLANLREASGVRGSEKPRQDKGRGGQAHVATLAVCPLPVIITFRDSLFPGLLSVTPRHRP